VHDGDGGELAEKLALAYNSPMEKLPICIVGLGYVGQPLAFAFAKHGFPVSGFDINTKRIEELQSGFDRTNELSKEDLASVNITYSSDPSVIGNAKVVIVALPTPVDDNNKPDLAILEAGTHAVGKQLKKGMIVVYESTVYPGVTEEICGPILEQESGLKCGTDFTLGYSPERINPGDKQHTVETIIKIVSGQDEKTADILCDLYGAIVSAGIHRAPSIKVAEMAKAIENAQRDINIAYINEVAMLCNHLGIRTKDVLDAAGTKWNFLKFQPGLVGGHCIGVDPFYLVEKAKQLGMDTHLITAGRTINDGMETFIANEVVKTSGGSVQNKRILVMGLTFKENVPDVRNSRSLNLMAFLKTVKGGDVYYYDPHVTKGAYQWIDVNYPPVTLSDGPFDVVLLLVKHKEFLELGTEAIINSTKQGGVIYDLKSVLDEKAVTDSGRIYMSL
jgi:UDP-N-acetyl-D-galactosamine dehydrogenase